MRKPTTNFLAGLFVATILLFVSVNAGLAQKQYEERTADDRAKLTELLQKGDTAAVEKIMVQYQANLPAAGEKPTSGSVFFEEIRACGFYPQETRLECIIDIKQQGGYAGPIGSRGSIEFVNFCVDWNDNQLFDQSEYVGLGSVQMHDESHQPANKAPWQYAVYRDFDPVGGALGTLDLRTTPGGNTTTTTSTGPTRKARAILSWFAPVNGCNQTPVWGNMVDFRIRFDPIR